VKKPRRHRPAVLPPQQPQQNPQQRNNTTLVGWSGPLPPPAALEAFNSVVPGGAERIFNQFEDEAKHRRALEDRQSRFVVRDVHIGQLLAGLFAMSGLAVSAFAIYLDKPWAGTIIGGGTIAPIVYAFLRQTRSTPTKPDRQD
jgi:uncharacterized membrane protein